MGAAEVTAFLTALAVERGVSTSTSTQAQAQAQARARAALLFLYGQVLRIELPWLSTRW